jgi:ribosomal-protein-serine acetyltransferase
MVVDFAVETLAVRRLEARAAVANGRGNGALRKLGAIQEGVLRRSFLKDGQHLDQMLWSILNEEWRQAKAVWGNGMIH